MSDLFFDSEFRAVIHPLTPEEKAGLVVSLKRDGNLAPIVVWKETQILLDGHHRYDICHEHGIPLLPPMELSFPDRELAKVWIIDNQLARRNVPAHVKIDLAIERTDILAKREQAEAQRREHGHTAPGRPSNTSVHVDKSDEPAPEAPVFTPIDVRAEVARAAGVGVGTVARYEIVRAKASPEQLAKLRKGDATINQVYKAVQGEEQRTSERARIETLALPEGEFSVIVADPPWPYDNRALDPTHRAANPYASMSLDNLRTFRIPAAPDAILWLWTTNAFLHEALHLLEAWGFTYKTTLTWAKEHMGLGDWLRGQTEHCLLAVKGSYRIFPGNTTTLLQARNTNHSAKPAEFYRLVGELCPGRKIDLFARHRREGWAVWGSYVGFQTE